MADLDDLEAQVEKTEQVEANATDVIANTPPPLDEVRLQELIDRLAASAAQLEAVLPPSARSAARGFRRSAANLKRYIRR